MALPLTFASAVRLRASQLLAMLVVLRGFLNSGAATCTGAVTLTAAAQDITGVTKTVTIVGANAYAVVTVNAQCVVTTASAGTLINVSLLVDGVNQAALGTLRCSMDQVQDGHRSFTWVIPTATLPAGSHTFKIQGIKSAAAGVAAISNTAGSNMVVQIYDMP